MLTSILPIDKFSFKAGYSVAYCESRGIDLGNQPNDKDID